MIISRHFVTVGNRRVHYRRGGEGPPLVLLHGSPANSELVLAEIAALAHEFTCFALDTPGFGSSDPLPGDTLSVADLADATGAAIEALGLNGTRLFGTHTGAAIALELGSRRPDLLGGLVLDGVPVFTRAEADHLFQGYFAPLVTDPLGGHLTATWMRFRDQFTWFPWLSRDPRQLNAIDRPEPEDVDLWARMFYRACRHYKPAYYAACFYCDGALRAAEALTLPTVFMATAEDMLFPHLDRLPPLKPGQSIRKLPGSFAAKLAAIGEAVKSLPGLPIAPPVAHLVLAGIEPALGFIDTPGGRILLRTFGHHDAPVIILLHDAPGSGAGLIALAKALSSQFRVFLPDLPGCGESTIIGDNAVTAAAQAVEALGDALDLVGYALFGRGIGATVAAAVAERRHASVGRILLDGLALPDAETAARIAPDLPLDPTGAHWLRAWMMVRDAETYAPWFDGRIAAQRHHAGDYDADTLHDRTFEIMKARTTYFRLPRDASGYDPVPGLSAAGDRLTLVTRSDGPHARHITAIAEACPAAASLPLHSEADQIAALRTLLS